MEYTNLGKTREKVSRIGLGAWQFSEAWGVTEYMQAKSVVSKAVELGINFFDTAMVYGLGLSEDLLGRALRELGVRRDEVFVTTKIPGDFLNPLDVYRSVEKSVEVLGLGYIDGLLAHWPPCWHNVPTRVYARALERLVDLGRVRYLGLSNFPIELVESFRSSLSKHDVEIFQVRYNLAERWADEEVVPYAERHGITIQAWSPLAKGALTGKYTLESLPKFTDVRAREAVFHPENFDGVWRLVQLLKSIGERYGRTPAQVALNWLITASPVVVPIPGAKAPEQVVELANSVGWRLSYSDWRALDELSRRVAISYSAYYLDYKPQQV
ncbi:MAG: aldo/keto reductase [Ignisphaera sp.]|nr:aldo/keto reductase [Ignisphaera sp.]MDW8085608.1 aldo/keto reductase [Ignisphaera sp.]